MGGDIPTKSGQVVGSKPPNPWHGVALTFQAVWRKSRGSSRQRTMIDRRSRFMRLNRALAMLGLAVTAGLALVWVEGLNLRLRQKATELYYRREQLSEEQAHLRLDV